MLLRFWRPSCELSFFCRPSRLAAFVLFCAPGPGGGNRTSAPPRCPTEHGRKRQGLGLQNNTTVFAGWPHTHTRNHALGRGGREIAPPAPSPSSPIAPKQAAPRGRRYAGLFCEAETGGGLHDPSFLDFPASPHPLPSPFPTTTQGNSRPTPRAACAKETTAPHILGFPHAKGPNDDKVRPGRGKKGQEGGGSVARPPPPLA